MKESDRKSVFICWLDKHCSNNYTTEGIVMTIDATSQYALSHKVCKQSFWEVINEPQFIVISSTVSGMKLFKLMQYNFVTIFEKYAAPLYKEFLHNIKMEGAVTNNMPVNIAMGFKSNESNDDSHSNKQPTYDLTEVIFIIDSYLDIKQKDSQLHLQEKAKYISDILRTRAINFENTTLTIVLEMKKTFWLDLMILLFLCAHPRITTHRPLFARWLIS